MTECAGTVAHFPPMPPPLLPECVRRWVAVVGVVLALSRSFVIEAGTAFDPEQAMLGAVVRCVVQWAVRWRGRAGWVGRSCCSSSGSASLLLPNSAIPAPPPVCRGGGAHALPAAALAGAVSSGASRASVRV